MPSKPHPPARRAPAIQEQGASVDVPAAADAFTGPLPRVLVPHPHVRSDVHVLGGSPHVVGSRVPVRRLWAWHRGGASVETLLKRYPSLGASKILDALAFAYDNQQLVDTDLAREQAFFARRGGPTVGARPLSQLSLFDDDP